MKSPLTPRAPSKIFLFAGLLCLALLPQLQAQVITNVYWDGDSNSTAGGSGALNTGVARWSTNGPSVGGTLVTPTSTNYVLNFGGTNGAINQSSATITSGGISWLTSGYTFTSSGTVRTLAGVTNADGTSYGTGVMFITNDANLTLLGAGGFTFSTMGISGGSGATLTLSNAAGEQTVTQFGTSSATSGRTNSVNTVIIGAGTNYIGTSGGNGFTQSGNITNNTSGLLILSNTAGGDMKVSGKISGAGAITLSNNGSGKIVLSASNDYSANTTIYASGSGQINMGDNSIFSTGIVTIAGTNTNYLRSALNGLNIANAAVVNSGSILQLGSTNSGWRMTWSGDISGAGGMAYAFSDNGVWLSSTNNSFGGGMNVGSSGVLYVTSLGNAGANSSLGTNDTLTFSSGANNGAGTLQWMGTNNETSDKTISLAVVSTNGGAGLKIYAGENSSSSWKGGTNVTLTLNGNINSVGTNNKVITLGAYNSNTLVMNGTINETLGFTNSLVVSATSNNGTVVLGNSGNSFSGPVSISSGAGSTNVLQVSAIGNSGNNSPLGKNGTINIGGSSVTGINVLKYVGTGETSDKVINLAGSFGGATLDQSGTGNLKFTSALGVAVSTNAKSLTLQGSTAGAGEFAGAIADGISNAVSVTKSGSGIWTLSGSNSYTGGTTIGAGTLRLGGVNALPAGGLLLGSSSSINASTLDLGVAGAYVLGSLGNSTTAGGYMSFTNSSGSATTLTFTGATNAITLSSGTSANRQVFNNSTDLTVSFNGAVDIGSSTAGAVTFGGAGNMSIGGAVFNTNTALRGLTKTGTGTVTLAGANTYNGDTVVSAGSLIVASSGSLSSSAVSISNGAAFRYSGSSPLSATLTVGGGGAGRAVLGGNGTINSSVTLDSLNDVLSPGNSPGILSLSQNQSWNAFTYDWEVNNWTGTTAGTDFDRISITGSLDLAGTAYGLNVLSLTALNVPGNVPNFSELNTTWTILSATGGITGFDAGNWAIDASGFTTGTAYLGSFSLAQVGNDLQLTYTVPEPSSVALLVFAGAGLGAWRFARRRKS